MKRQLAACRRAPTGCFSTSSRCCAGGTRPSRPAARRGRAPAAPRDVGAFDCGHLDPLHQSAPAEIDAHIERAGQLAECFGADRGYFVVAGEPPRFMAGAGGAHAFRGGPPANALKRLGPRVRREGGIIPLRRSSPGSPTAPSTRWWTSASGLAVPAYGRRRRRGWRGTGV